MIRTMLESGLYTVVQQWPLATEISHGSGKLFAFESGSNTFSGLVEHTARPGPWVLGRCDSTAQCVVSAFDVGDLEE